MIELCFATGNKGKIAEAKAILGVPLQAYPMELDELQSLDLEQIVTHKVKQAYMKVGKPVFVDDVGLYVQAFNGFPGPFVKFLLEAGGNGLLLKMLSGQSDRNVIARAAIAYHDGTNIHTFIGDVKGVIAPGPRGEGGWGWDPVFIPEGKTMTYAEMGPVEKNAISHRRAALEKLKQYLREQGSLQ